jgi:NDP-sugar pyrophosphorylase family protein
LLSTQDFFDLSSFAHKELFDHSYYVWDTLLHIKSYIKDVLNPNVRELIKQGEVIEKTCILYRNEVIKDGFEIESGDVTKGKLKIVKNDIELKGATIVYQGAVIFDKNIYLGENTVVEPGALIKGPAIIGHNTELRQGAYIRGNCIVGNRCVVGHTTEMKSTVMLDDAKAGHFAYLGDSILGNGVNLGAGTKLANLKMNNSEVILKIKDRAYETGLRKFGAILGDKVQTGCNSVTSPGALVGKYAMVYPALNVPTGYYPPECVVRPEKDYITIITQV